MKILLLILMFNVSTLLAAADEGKINIMTEVYPPYNMQVNGKLKGISVEILDLMLERMKLDQNSSDVMLTNWSRAYSMALKKKGNMVFSTTRTAKRENLFKWVGPIVETKIGILAPKSKHITLNSLTELKQYRVGAVLKDIGEQLILEGGIDKKHIHSIGGQNAIELSFKKMENDRIDMFAYDFVVAKYQAKLKGYDVDDYEEIYTLKEAGLYYAFNKATSDKTIAKWQNALDTIKDDGSYNEILAKY